MNEQIRQLATQCFVVDTQGNISANAYMIERFAELIVQECISLFDGTKEIKTVGVLTHDQVGNQIKQHFGVKS